ncbi:unnamed protein product, partial [Rotaria sordida]
MKASNSTLIPNGQRHPGQLPSNSQNQIERQQQHIPLGTKKNKRRKKCHGNRKLQRFKKKWRKRGLTEEEIQKLINEYNHSNQDRNQTNNRKTNLQQDTTVEKMEVSNGLNDNINENNTTTSKSNKRKQQMTPSSSQRSTSRPSVKRMKRSKSSQITMTPLKTNFKLPIYLKAHPNLL